MTMSAVLIEPKSSELLWWSAGAPPIIIVNSQGVTEVISAYSSPLGYASLNIEETRRPLQKGDRIFMFTDGIYEFKTATGTQFGIRNFSRVCSKIRDSDVEGARRHLVERLSSLHGESPLDDDQALILIDFLNVA